jgi:hypothetical protein
VQTLETLVADPRAGQGGCEHERQQDEQAEQREQVGQGESRIRLLGCAGFSESGRSEFMAT